MDARTWSFQKIFRYSFLNGNFFVFGNGKENYSVKKSQICLKKLYLPFDFSLIGVYFNFDIARSFSPLLLA